MIPDGKGPSLVLINPIWQAGVLAAYRRGYISAGYAGNDGMDDGAALTRATLSQL